MISTLFWRVLRRFLFPVHICGGMIPSGWFSRRWVVVFFLIFTRSITIEQVIWKSILELIIASSRTEIWKGLLWRRLSLGRNETISRLEHWYQTYWDSILSLSEKSENDTSMVDISRSDRTSLLFKASAKYVWPSSSMRFWQILSIVRLCERRGCHCDGLSSQKRHSLTWLLFKASPRHWNAPPSVFVKRILSLVSVCRRRQERWDEQWQINTSFSTYSTWLIFNASPRLRSPSSSEILNERFNVVSACQGWTASLTITSKLLSHSVDLQGISKILYTFVANRIEVHQ